ncbi:hypothetical protein IC575_014067 [Cucumis melo]
MEYLFLISPEQSTDFRNIDLPLEMAMKFINDFLCESLQPSLTMLTPFLCHSPLIGINSLLILSFPLQ